MEKAKAPSEIPIDVIPELAKFLVFLAEGQNVMSPTGGRFSSPENDHFSFDKSLRGRNSICGKMDTLTRLNVPLDSEQLSEGAAPGGQGEGCFEGKNPARMAGAKVSIQGGFGVQVRSEVSGKTPQRDLGLPMKRETSLASPWCMERLLGWPSLTCTGRLPESEGSSLANPRPLGHCSSLSRKLIMMTQTFNCAQNGNAEKTLR